MHSLTEENYLKAIYKLLENKGEPVSTNAIAEKVNTKAASVTDMLKKFSEKGLVNYKKYQGVTLTRKGKDIAVNIIRKHRLWEFFLVEKLNFKWDEVHDMAEELEHIKSHELVERLDKYLGYPRFDPHGDPIPDTHGKFHPHRNTISLSDSSEHKKGEKFIMTGVIDHSPAYLQHLASIGMILGDRVEIKAVVEYDNSLLISVNKKKSFYISSQIAQNILVVPENEN